MMDIEQRVQQHLRAVADRAEPRPDLQAVFHGPALAPGSSKTPGRRRSVSVAAAASVGVVGVVGLVLIRPDGSSPTSDQPIRVPAASTLIAPETSGSEVPRTATTIAPSTPPILDAPRQQSVVTSSVWSGDVAPPTSATIDRATRAAAFLDGGDVVFVDSAFEELERYALPDGTSGFEWTISAWAERVAVAKGTVLLLFDVSGDDAIRVADELAVAAMGPSTSSGLWVVLAAQTAGDGGAPKLQTWTHIDSDGEQPGASVSIPTDYLPLIGDEVGVVSLERSTGELWYFHQGEPVSLGSGIAIAIRGDDVAVIDDGELRLNDRQSGAVIARAELSVASTPASTTGAATFTDDGRSLVALVKTTTDPSERRVVRWDLSTGLVQSRALAHGAVLLPGSGDSVVVAGDGPTVAISIASLEVAETLDGRQRNELVTYPTAP